MSQIDETEPGSETDGNDGVAEQLSVEDSLLDTRIDDVLDEGYSPPDREPSVHVPTEAEEERGESLDELLSAETPDVWAQDERQPVRRIRRRSRRRAGRSAGRSRLRRLSRHREGPAGR